VLLVEATGLGLEMGLRARLLKASPLKPFVLVILVAVTAYLAEETLGSRHAAFTVSDRSIQLLLHYRADDHHILTLLFCGGCLFLATSYALDVLGKEQVHQRMAMHAYYLYIVYVAVGTVLYALAFFLEGSRHLITDDVFLVMIFPRIFEAAQVSLLAAGVLCFYWLIDAFWGA